jgi:stage II sporulation protein AA (anti-sigma F factor antagonist)
MFKIDIRQIQDNKTLVSLEGPLDNTTVSAFEESIEPLLDKRQNLTLFFDFTKLNYLNSTGIARLLQYHLHLKSANGRLKIFGVSEFISEIMMICGASKLLEIYKDREEALSS